MTPDFQFYGFVPSDDLKTKASRVLDRLLTLAPYGSMAIAALQRDGTGYSCSIEVFSKHGPFVARRCDDEPEAALEKAVKMLSKKFERWHEAVRPTVLQPRFVS